MQKQKLPLMFAALFYIAVVLAHVYVYKDTVKILKLYTPPRSDPVRQPWPPSPEEADEYFAVHGANRIGACFNYEATFNMELFFFWAAWIHIVGQLTFLMVFFVIRRKRSTINVYNYKCPNEGVFIC